MDKENLEKKIAELLDSASDESSFVFKKFKEKLVEYLNIGEAIKINNLGVFQLKEQLGENLSDSKKGKPTLLFSPDPSLASENSLFLNLEIETKRHDPTVFDENVFQVGIGKQMIPLDEKAAQENTDDSFKTIDQRVDELISNSEKINNFDLWDDYLDSKKSASIIDEEKIKDELDSIIDDEMVSKVTEQLYEDDFEELNEEEIFDELMNEGNLDNNELNEITSQIGEKVESDEILKDVFQENIDENVDDLEDEVLENFDQNQLFDSSNNEETKLNNFEDLDTELKNEKEVVDENLDLDENSDVDDEGKSRLKIMPIIEKKGSEVKPRLTSEKFSETPSEKLQSRVISKKKSPLVFGLISIFVIVASLGVYYLFFANPTWLYDPHEVEIKLSEQHAKEFENAKLSESNDDFEKGEDKPVVISKIDSLVKLDSPLIPKEEKSIPIDAKEELPSVKKEIKKSELSPTLNENNTEITLLEANGNETESAKNIYYDGTGYSVQVSSWRQLKIAENDARRIIKLGYPAHIIKVFVQKFNGTWHRVRIGPYKTLDEAKLKQTQFK